MLESAARANDLPVAFLVRVIWRESRFDPLAVGPRTRSGAHAQGIAQFMARTAAERAPSLVRLGVDHVDRRIPARARDEFGNLGLAAAAYNAGPAGFADGLMARARCPMRRSDTSGDRRRSIGEWGKAGNVPMVTPEADCLELVASLEQGPSVLL
jgi:soluble lytic murein transglycosylase-like protein